MGIFYGEEINAIAEIDFGNLHITIGNPARMEVAADFKIDAHAETAQVLAIQISNKCFEYAVVCIANGC